MLRTCHRCKERRTKCDNQLPACANCSNAHTDCIFTDTVTGDTISRSYIKGLYSRIEQLKAVLNSQEQNSLPSLGEPMHDGRKLESRSFHIFDDRTGQNFYLNMSSPALIASFTIDQLKIPLSSTGPPPWPSLENLHLPSNSGRGLITAKIIRSLMSHYNSVIKPQYSLPLAPHEKPFDEFTSLDQGPLMPRFSILLTCAMSAAHRGYYETEWLSISRICRDWAGEISELICALPSQDAMAATVSLLVYELAEPSRGLLWDLYDSSIRLCLELGWHCFQNADDRPSRQEPFMSSNSDPALSPRFQIVSLLESLHRSLKMVFNRPSMMDSLTLTPDIQESLAMSMYTRACLYTFGPDSTTSNMSISTENDLLSLIKEIRNFGAHSPIIHETWLLFLPLCASREAFARYFDTSKILDLVEDLPHLRVEILQAAFQIIESTYNEVIRDREFAIPLFATSRAFKAGCALIIASKMGWEISPSWPNALIKCTAIITACGLKWRHGKMFCDVWTAICSSLEE